MGGEITIEMDKLLLGGAELCKGGNCKATIDTGCSGLWGPEASVGKYLTDFGELLCDVCNLNHGY